MTRKGLVYYEEQLAGCLIEDSEGYHFYYDTQYLSREDSQPISRTLPITEDAYHSNTMFPFFDGLIPDWNCSTHMWVVYSASCI